MLKKMINFLFSKLIGKLPEKDKEKIMEDFGKILREIAVSSAKEAIKKNIK